MNREIAKPLPKKGVRLEKEPSEENVLDGRRADRNKFAFAKRDVTEMVEKPRKAGFLAILGGGSAGTSKTVVFSRRDVVELTTEHVPDIEDMVTNDTYRLFGDVNAYDIVYRSYLTLGLLNSSGEIVAAISFTNYPNIKSVPPWCWRSWLRKLYGCDFVNQRNSLWIHLLVWREEHTRQFLQPMLQYFFREQSFKEYVVLIIPPKVSSTYFLGEYGIKVHPRDGVTTGSCLGIFARHFYVKSYKMRLAIEEDNDDLIRLLSKCSPIIQETYGDYYVSELLTRFPDTKRHILVADFERHPVAVMIINDVLNYEYLNEHYELLCYNGLKKGTIFDDPGSPETEYTDPRQYLEHRVSMIPSLIPLIFTPPEEIEKDWQEVDENWDLDDSIFEILCDLGSYLVRLQTRDSDSSSDDLSYDEDISQSVWELSYEERNVVSRPSKRTSAKCHFISGQALSTLPQFYGDDDAFALEATASKDEHKEAIDHLLQLAFEMFPDKNYCVATVPCTEPPVSGFFEKFVKVPPRTTDEIPTSELFVLHKNTLVPDLIVRIACKGDINYISSFMDQVSNSSLLWIQIETAIEAENDDTSCYLCFLMIAYQQIVGLAILSENIEWDYVMSHYCLYLWVDGRRPERGTYGVIENLILHPPFQNFAPFFLTQLHALSGYMALFYLMTPQDISVKRRRPICNVLQQLIPVRPRNVQHYSAKHLARYEFMPNELITSSESPFSLFFSMTRLSGMCRIEVTTRIVVVGSGDTSASFLETLICTVCRDLLVTFPRLVVVSPHGLEHQLAPNKARDMFFVHRTHFNYRYMYLTSLRAHVNFVTGVMTQIDREEKRIILADDTYVPYDILILMVGEQYQLPSIVKSGYSHTPLNAFVINTDTDATYALKKLNEIMSLYLNPDGKIIIYGRDLRCYCAIAALIEYGIPTDFLVYVIPPMPLLDVENQISYDYMIFDDPEIDVAMMATLKDVGVTIYQGEFVGWDVNIQTNYVTHTYFCIQRGPPEGLILCKAIFMYSEKAISMRTFKAYKEAQLVFDGKLIIDTNFRTNDESIYAAGPGTRYSRKYHSDLLAHLYYNPEEVGQKVAMFMREMLIPQEYKDERLKKPDYFPLKICKKPFDLPYFTKPLIKVCTLMGGLNYCHITKPGRQVPPELKYHEGDFGRLYVTGDLQKLEKQGYFKLHINKSDKVRTITCLTYDILDVDSLLRLWNKTVSVVNDVHLKFEHMRIPDLFDFFKEPWTCGAYYDKFDEVQHKINDIISGEKMSDGKSIAQTVYDAYIRNDWGDLTEKQKSEIESKFRNSRVKGMVDHEIVKCVEENAIELPMYGYPNLLMDIAYKFSWSPMLKH